MRKGALEHALSGVRVQAPFGARVQKVQRVEVGASKLLKAPSLYKTFTTALRAREKPPEVADRCNAYFAL